MKHVGIVACSAEGAALCYRTICAEGARRFGEHAHPEISLHSHSLADYVRCIDADDWRGVGDLMLSSAAKLQRAGAGFAICPDNTIHRAFDHVSSRSPIPWLHIADVVSSHAARAGWTRVGLTGTRWLVESDVYPAQLTKRGLEYRRPSDGDAAEMNRAIMNELVNGVFERETVEFFQGVIARFRDERCDAVILGCTEIPLIINDANSPLPTLDSTRLLARAALEYAE
ncbi:MAG: amino acid racemase [Acidobacteriota bacterium]|nr:amino acid racemase [Acidobacteriota bacterium]